MQTDYLNLAKNAFNNGQYLEAYDNYFRFGQLIGMEKVNNNLKICLKRFNKNRDYDKVALKDLNVAAIMDEFTYQNFLHECNIYLLTPQNWKEELNTFSPDLLFVESAWAGKNGEWQNKINHISNELKCIVNLFKVQNIPTSFWNKEDPGHFYDFLNIAKLFDFIFTTDIEKIPVYKYKLNHERVYLLPYAAQPFFHNPIEKYEREDILCFAGSYYSKYKERCEDFKDIVDEVINIKDIAIFDRHYGDKSPNYKFPEKYKKYIKGSLPFSEIDKAYKGYKYGLNINSAKYSASFFARRVFELMSSNTLVISNYSKGLINFFGGLLLCSDKGSDILLSLIKYDEQEFDKVKLCALRKIMEEHCYHHRLDFISQNILGRKSEDFYHKLVIFSFPENEKQFERIIKIFNKQSFNKKLLYIFVSNFNITKNTLDQQKNGKIIIKKYNEHLSTPLSDFIENNCYISVIENYNWYGVNFYKDLMLFTTFLKFKNYGKGEYYEYKNKNFLINNNKKQYEKSDNINLNSGIIFSNCIDLSQPLQNFKNNLGKSFKGFSIDRFNYCKNGAFANYNQIIDVCSDNINIDRGYSLRHINEKIKEIKPEDENFNIIKTWNLENIFTKFNNQSNAISIIKFNKYFKIISSMRNEEFYSLTSYHFSVYDIPNIENLYIWMETEGNLDISYSFSFKDKNNSPLTWLGNSASGPNMLSIPINSRYFNFSINIFGSGISIIKKICFGQLIKPNIKL